MEHIQFGPVDFSTVQAFFKPENPDFMLLCDRNTENYCKDLFLRNNHVPTLVLEPGEAHKTIEQCQKIWDFALEHNLSRNSVIINLGGGLVSDLGGFAASVFKRGIRFVNVPTSLLAMVDATVGAKTGINYHSAKNILGSFSEPSQIFISTDWLKTLPKVQILSGKAEMLKHALLHDISFFQECLNDEIPSLELIKKSIALKWEVVEQDPFEKRYRKCLNFGHTAGHAVESILTKTGKEISHGHCVVAGMIMEMKVAELIGLAPENSFDAIIKDLINLYGKLELQSINEKEWLGFMANDKKNLNSEIKPALLKSAGQIDLDQIITPEIWSKALKYYIHDC